MKEKRHRDFKKKKKEKTFSLHTGVSRSVIVIYDDITKGKRYSVTKYSSSQMCKGEKNNFPFQKCELSPPVFQLTV